jgi:hypothetical protein
LPEMCHSRHGRVCRGGQASSQCMYQYQTLVHSFEKEMLSPNERARKTGPCHAARHQHMDDREATVCFPISYDWSRTEPEI